MLNRNRTSTQDSRMVLPPAAEKADTGIISQEALKVYQLLGIGCRVRFDSILESINPITNQQFIVDRSYLRTV